MSRFDRVSIPNPRIAGGLNAPGVTAPPPDLRSAQGADAVGGLLAITGGIANVLNNLAEQDLAAQRRAEYEAEQAANQAERDAAIRERDMRGIADKHRDRRLAEIQSDLASGKMTIPAGMDPKEWADAIIAEDVQGFDPIYADQYGKSFGNLVDVAIAYRAVETKRAFATKADLVANSLSAPEATTDQARALVTSLRDEFPNMTEDEIRALTVIPAAKLHAEQGNVAKAREIMAALPEGSFRESRLEVDQLAERAVTRQNAQISDAFRNRIAAMRNDGSPPEAILAAIRADDTVSDNLKESERIATEEYASKRVAKITKAQKDLAYQRQEAAAVGSVRTMLSGGYTVSELPEIPEAVLPDGSTVAIPQKKVIELAVNDQMAQIGTLYANNPAERLNAELDFLASTGAVYEPWKAEWQGVATRLSGLPTDVPVIVDERTVAAVQRFRQIRAEGRGGIIASHLEPGTRQYLNDLVTAMESRAGAADGGDAAMPEAIRMVNSKTNAALLGKRKLSPSDRLVDEAAASLAGDLGVDSVRKLSDHLYAKAQYKIDTNPNIAPDQAIEQARLELAQDFVAVDGMAAMVRGRMTPADADAVNEIVPLIKEQWRTTTTRGRNASPDLDYRLGFNELSGNFSIVGTRDGVATGDYDTQFSMSADEVAGLARWNASRRTLLDSADEAERSGYGSLLGWINVLVSGGEALPPDPKKPDPALAGRLRAMANKIPDGLSPTGRIIAERILSQPKAPGSFDSAIIQGMSSYSP